MSKWRGHDIHYDTNEWVYADGQPVKDNPDKDCGHCGLANTPEGYDGCLGKLPGVMNACCGHGSDEEAYLQFEGGEVTFMVRCSLCDQFVAPDDMVIHQPDTPLLRLEPEDPQMLCLKCVESN